MKSSEGWETPVLREMESGIDVGQLKERLALTPTERIERMLALMRSLGEMQSRDADS